MKSKNEHISNDSPMVGVETGLALFVVIVSLLTAGLNRLQAGSAQLMVRTAPYAIGGVAAFWTFQRVGSFLT